MTTNYRVFCQIKSIYGARIYSAYALLQYDICLEWYVFCYALLRAIFEPDQ